MINDFSCAFFLVSVPSLSEIIFWIELFICLFSIFPITWESRDVDSTPQHLEQYLDGDDDHTVTVVTANIDRALIMFPALFWVL